MSQHNINYLLHPGSVAVVGASNRPGSIGLVVTQNLMGGGFAGPILPVNPKEKEIAGQRVYGSVASLPDTPEMAVVCTPPATVPNIIQELGARGTKVAVVITAGLASIKDASGQSLQTQILQSARASRMRILGPNCLGVLSAGSQLNASFTHLNILPGKIAFIAQSGALCASVLDWAGANKVGFSHLVSLGDLGDIDFGDMLDYLGSDAQTDAILLYIETIGAGRAREFMSAARAAARNKPVIAVKAGRNPEGQRAAQSHTGALAGNDMVYDAALRRAGVLRVMEISELFDAAETLARVRPYRGDRLAIVTNGGGPGVMATDALVEHGGRLAEFSTDTMQQLDRVLPATWSHGNPVDLIGDAHGHRYADALSAVISDRGVDAVLVINVPTALASGADSGRHVIAATRDSAVPLFTCWIGQSTAETTRDMLREAGLATYTTPEVAVRAFMHTVEFHRNQEALRQVPDSTIMNGTPRLAEVRELIAARLQEGVSILSEVDAKAVLSAYGIPVVETAVARDADSAVKLAERLGYPVAVKIVSPQITHKSDVGGVALNLDSPEALRAAVLGMRERVMRRRPEATIEGFAVQQMLRRPGAHELIVGAAVDGTFGPVILFGHGGTAVEVLGDRSVSLPPLNSHLAKEAIARTRVRKLLAGYRDRPAADIAAIERTLIQVSQLMIDHPQIIELDINPLLADERGVIALDSRVRIAAAQLGADRLAIRPYPKELEEMVTLRDGRKLLTRPIRPEDQPAHERFIAHLSPEDIRSRFLSTIRRLEASQMARLTQIDYDREMAFIAVTDGKDGPAETLGVVRAMAGPDNEQAEFAIVVRSDTKARGLGYALMNRIIRYCRQRGTRELVGEVLAENHAMLKLAEELGFEATHSEESEIVNLRLRIPEKDSEMAGVKSR